MPYAKIVEAYRAGWAAEKVAPAGQFLKHFKDANALWNFVKRWARNEIKKAGLLPEGWEVRFWSEPQLFTHFGGRWTLMAFWNIRPKRVRRPEVAWSGSVNAWGMRDRSEPPYGGYNLKGMNVMIHTYEMYPIGSLGNDEWVEWVGAAHIGSPLTRKEAEELLSQFWDCIRSARMWLRLADLNYRAGDLYRCCIATNRAEREHARAEGCFNALLALLGRPAMEEQDIYDRLGDELARLGSEIDGSYDRCRCFAAWQQL